MRSYLDLMSHNLSAGLESIDGVEKVYTEEELMAQEIALESAIDDSAEDFENALMESSIESAYNFMADLAEYELTKDVAIGIEAKAMYDNFGLGLMYEQLEKDLGTEAAKDVLARKGKMAWAAIKALLNSCLTWLKNLFGLNQSAGKIFSSLETKAKAIKKDLTAKASKKSNSDADKDVYSNAPAAVEKLGDIYGKFGSTIKGIRQQSGASSESINDVVIPVTADMFGMESFEGYDMPISGIRITGESIALAYDLFKDEIFNYDTFEEGMEAVDNMVVDYLMYGIESEIYDVIGTEAKKEEYDPITGKRVLVETEKDKRQKGEMYFGQYRGKDASGNRKRIGYTNTTHNNGQRVKTDVLKDRMRKGIAETKERQAQKARSAEAWKNKKASMGGVWFPGDKYPISNIVQDTKGALTSVNYNPPKPPAATVTDATGEIVVAVLEGVVIDAEYTRGPRTKKPEIEYAEVVEPSENKSSDAPLNGTVIGGSTGRSSLDKVEADIKHAEDLIIKARTWYDEIASKLPELYDKEDRRTVSSSSLYAVGLVSLEVVIGVCEKYKKVDNAKAIKDAIQAIEKVRDKFDQSAHKEMQDGKVKPEVVTKGRAALNAAISALNKASVVLKATLKEFVRASEGCLSNGRMAVSGMNAK